MKKGQTVSRGLSRVLNAQFPTSLMVGMEQSCFGAGGRRQDEKLLQRASAWLLEMAVVRWRAVQKGAE